MDYKPKTLTKCFTALLQTLEFKAANSVSMFDFQLL